MKNFFVCSCFVLFLKKIRTSFVNFEENRWLEGSSSASFQHDLSRERKFSDHKLKFRHAQNAMNQRATCKNSNFLSGRRLSLNGYFFLSFFFPSTWLVKWKSDESLATRHRIQTGCWTAFHLTTSDRERRVWHTCKCLSSQATRNVHITQCVNVGY